MKYYIIAVLLFLSCSCLADPDWQPVVYTNSTVAYSQVTIDDIPATEGDLLAAFIEAECRGVAEIFTDNGAAYATMNIQGDVPEMVSFLVWDQSIDTICSVEYTTMTNPGYDIGYPPDFLPIFAYSGNPINHYPVMNLPASLIIPEDIPTNFDFSEFCSDPDNDPLTVTGEDSEHISVSADGLIVCLSSAADWVGFEYVTFWLSDGSLSVHDSLEVFVTAVNDPPQITDTYPPEGYIEVEQWEPVSFAVTAHDIDSAINYAWSIDGTSQPSTDYIMNVNFSVLGEHLVVCSVSDEQYQVTAQWQVQVNVEPVTDNTLDDFLQISPNPCSDQLVVEWSLRSSSPQDISIYDLRGRKVMQLQPQRSGFIKTNKITQLPPGVYILNCRIGSRIYNQKFTVK